MGLDDIYVTMYIAIELSDSLPLVSRSLESGGYPWRYSRIGVAECGMGGIFGVHFAMLLLGFEWYRRDDNTAF